MISSPTTWYLARAGGVVAYVLITAAVVAGVALAGRARVPGFPRFAVEDLHRFLGLLAGVFVTAHVAGILVDRTVPFSLGQALVPFTASYRPLWTGSGVVAMELLVALAVTNRLRRRMPYRLWRAVHMLNYLVWAAATVHGVMSGSDRDQPWLIALYVLAATAVAGAAATRAATRLAAVAAALGAAAAVFTLLSISPGARSAAARTAALPARFSGALAGQIETSDAASARIVSVVGTAGSARSLAFRIDLVTGDGRVSDTALQLRYRDGATCAGTLASLDDTGFAGSCRLANGGTRSVRARWSVRATSVSGTLVTS